MTTPPQDTPDETNNPESYGDPTMDRDATMDRRLHEGLRDLPTKQNHDPQKENTALLHHHQRRHPPLPTDCDGPYYGTPAATWTQCHTNHSRSWMLTCSHLPPMFRHHHRPWNCPALPELHLPMVWPTDQDDKRPGPQIHFTIRQSAHRKAWDPTEPIHGIPSPNGRTIRTKKPMDRAISTTGNF